MRVSILLCALALFLSLARSQCTKPSTPVFNDATYYSAAYAVETNGAKLRAALTDIISEDWVYYTYSCMWTVLEYTDEDPRNSSNVILTYSQNSYPKANRDTGTETIAWNREHTWPKSRGFPGDTTYPYNDAHHLRACDKRVNTQRNDKDFKDGGTALCVYPYQSSSCQVYAYQTSSTFEVPDEHKGDVARMMFYMDVRYEGQSSKEPDLTLVEAASVSGPPDFGFLCTLLGWHKEDPVSTEEKNRHTKIFEWHLNRNPFVDHPEWVSTIFGSC